MQMLYHKVNKKEIQITYCKFVLEYQDHELKLTACKITTNRQFLCPSWGSSWVWVVDNKLRRYVCTSVPSFAEHFRSMLLDAIFSSNTLLILRINHGLRSKSLVNALHTRACYTALNCHTQTYCFLHSIVFRNGAWLTTFWTKKSFFNSVIQTFRKLLNIGIC